MKKKYRVTRLGYFVFSGLALLIVLLAFKMPSLISTNERTDNQEASSLANSSEVNSSESEAATTDPIATNTESVVTGTVSTAAETADLKAVKDKQLRDMRVSIFFEPNKYDVSSTYYNSLDNFIQLAIKYPDAVIIIEGNYNGYPGNRVSAFWTSLANNRAEVVNAYLVAKGIPSERMKLVNNGCSKMINKDDSLEELGKNRRVDVSFANE